MNVAPKVGDRVQLKVWTGLKHGGFKYVDGTVEALEQDGTLILAEDADNAYSVDQVADIL